MKTYTIYIEITKSLFVRACALKDVETVERGEVVTLRVEMLRV